MLEAQKELLKECKRQAIEQHFALEMEAEEELSEAIKASDELVMNNKKMNLDILKEKRKNLYI